MSGELCELARRGDYNKIEMLLAVGCAIDAKDYDDRTCLHLAASEGVARVVETLMNFGADTNMRDR